MSLSKRSPTPSLSARSFAKVNLGLKLIARRADGFHELRTVLQTVDLWDTLRYIPRRDRRIVLKCNDPYLPLSSENLIVRAAKLWLEAAQVREGITVCLEKRIPVGAGLGGGSSNAATTLLALERLFVQKLPSGRLHELAGELGSDVPFFLSGGQALGMGRGDVLVLLPDLKRSPLVLVCPHFSIATRDAYRKASLWLTKKYKTHNMARFRLKVFEKTSALGLFENDFESVLFPDYPELGRLKSRLVAAGAEHAQMTGSGSAVFGVFRTWSDARQAEKKLQSHPSPSSPALTTFVVRSVLRSQYLKRMFAALE